MGLSFRSRIFGVSLVIGLHYTGNIILLAWRFRHQSMFNTHNVIHGITDCIVYGVLIAYFAVEEPVRKFILLPTTSPFFTLESSFTCPRQDPGYVAVGVFQPDAFAPAELEIMRRATIR